jgi:hypothetical protein
MITTAHSLACVWMTDRPQKNGFYRKKFLRKKTHMRTKRNNAKEPDRDAPNKFCGTRAGMPGTTIVYASNDFSAETNVFHDKVGGGLHPRFTHVFLYIYIYIYIFI